MEVPQDHTRLKELIGLLREGQLDASHMQELEAILDNDPAAMAYYIESVDLYTLLDRQQGQVIQSQPETVITPCLQESPSKRSISWPAMAWLATAACLGIMIGLIASQWLIAPPPNAPIADTKPIPSTSPEIATLSATYDCQWAQPDTLRYEGQRLASESLHLLKGIATVRFDSDVRLILEGPMRLDLVAVDQAYLHEGKAVFSSIDDLDHFTLRTPFSEIQDEGTEYAVSVDPKQETVEVHVFDGRVLYAPPQTGKDPVHVDAGEARRFASSQKDEAIPLAPLEFIRTPVIGTTHSNSPQVDEWFAYDSDTLVGQNGGKGWAGPWILPGKAKERPDLLQAKAPLLWPGLRPHPNEGSLLIHDHTALHRPLAEPIRMDQNATYYLSFLVYKEPVPPETRKHGWAFVTLHGQVEEKIAIAPMAHNGEPRVIHNGRATKAPMRLQADKTYFFVCKIQARRKKPDQVFVRVYENVEDIDAVETSTWHIRTDPMQTDSVFTKLNIYSRDSLPLRLDGIRIGRTWASVTAQKDQ